MGNTPAKDSRQNIYSSYIQQQQELIYKQQQQINSLFQHNIQNQQQQNLNIPPNMLFQNNDTNQSSSQLPHLPPHRTTHKMGPY